MIADVLKTTYHEFNLNTDHIGGVFLQKLLTVKIFEVCIDCPCARTVQDFYQAPLFRAKSALSSHHAGYDHSSKSSPLDWMAVWNMSVLGRLFCIRLASNMTTSSTANPFRCFFGINNIVPLKEGHVSQSLTRAPPASSVQVGAVHSPYL